MPPPPTCRAAARTRGIRCSHNRRSRTLEPLRREIAIAAARLIADSALDYASAKRKAVREVLGTDNAPRGVLPDNHEVDDCLREHLELFDADAHVERVRELREQALALMDLLAPFQPYVTGAAWKGIAAEHAPLHLQLFCDNAKEAEIFMVNAGIRYTPIEVPHFRGNATVEGALFERNGIEVLVSIYDSGDLRGALRAGEHGAERGTRAQLAERLAAEADA